MTEQTEFLDQRRDESLDELQSFLRIPSVSALPEHTGDVQTAAEWVAQRLRAAGIEHVEVMPTGGHPVVYGDWLHAEGKPTVLIYGHFVVQPTDPLELWESPPFEPAIRDGRIYARGVSDMKANLLMSVLGAEASLRTAGELPVNVKFILEGQEEIGSPELPAFVAANRDLLACDVVLSGDGMQWSEDQPQVLLGMKGLAGIQIDVHGANADLHSGLYGGAVANPIHALVRILDSMRSPDGAIMVDGFYEDVVPLTPAERTAIAEVPFDEAAYMAELGVDELFGEPGYSTLERAWVRPTLEVNGIWGGFQGAGIKTVLPCQAHAKITCRLVPNQEPAHIVELLTAHVHAFTTPGVKVDVQPLPGAARAYAISPNHPANRAAEDVLAEIYGTRPYHTRLGGSVPVCEIFLQQLDAYTVSFGFGQADEQIHAPNEFLRLGNFERGQVAWAALLQRLGATRDGA